MIMNAMKPIKTNKIKKTVLPNRETAKAIKEARQRKKVIICKDSKDLFEKLRLL